MRVRKTLSCFAVAYSKNQEIPALSDGLVSQGRVKMACSAYRNDGGALKACARDSVVNGLQKSKREMRPQSASLLFRAALSLRTK